MRAAAGLVIALALSVPALAQTALERGATLIDTGRFAEAKVLADEALKGTLNDTDKAAALLIRGQALAGLHDCKAAVPDLEAARKLYPGSDVHADLGDCYFALGDFADAADHLQADLKRNPNNTSRIKLGQALVQLGRLDEAEETLKAAIAVDPKDADAAKALADVRAKRASPKR